MKPVCSILSLPPLILLFAISASPALALPPSVPLVAQAVAPVESTTLSGRLSEASELSTDGSYYNEHTFTGQAGQAITVEMVTQEFSAYLILIDPQGRTLAISSALSGTDPQIGLALPATGTYTLVANSVSPGETGNYQIQIQVADTGSAVESDTEPTDARQAVAPIEPLTVDGVLDPNVSVLDGIPFYGEHTFAGVAGQAIAIEMTSPDFDALLILLDPEGNSLAQDNDGLTGTDARITTLLPTTGTYTIQALTANDEFGHYQVQLRPANADDQQLIDAEQLDRQAMQLFYQMRYEDALPLMEQQVQILTEVLGDRHPELRYSLNNLAAVHEMLGHSAEAEALHQQALSIVQATWGEHHETVVDELNNLASFYRRQGNTSEAERAAQRAAQIEAELTKAEPKSMPQSQVKQHEQQVKQHEQPERDEAELRQVEAALQSLGEDLTDRAPDAALATRDLKLYRQLRDSDTQIEALYQQALRLQERLFGEADLTVATTLDRLASTYQRQNKLAEAEPLYQRSLHIREQALGDTRSAQASQRYSDVATSLNNLALLYQTQERYADAEPLYLRSLQIGDQIPDWPPLHRAITLNNLALLYAAQANYAAAQPLFSQVLEIQQQIDDRSAEVAMTLNALAEVEHRQGHDAQAEPLYRRSLELQEQAVREQEQSLNEDNYNSFVWNVTEFAYSLTALADLYRTQTRYSEAEPLYRRALLVQKRFLGADHPDVAALYTSLGLIHNAQGDYTQAEFFYRQALTIFRESSVNPDTDPLVATTLNHLTNLYLAQGNATQASILRRTIDQAVSQHLQANLTNQSAATDAFETLLQQKGRNLDVMADTAQNVQDLTLNDQDLSSQLRSRQAELAALLYAGQDDDSIDRYQAQIAQLRSQIEALENAVAQQNPDHWMNDRLISQEAIAAAIPADAALIEYVRYQPFDPTAPLDQLWGSPRYAAYLLDSQNNLQWVDLGDAATIDSLVAEFRDGLRQQNFRVNTVARHLDAAVMAPIRSKLGNAQHLLLSPDGQLNLIPFAALVDESDRYLVETYTFTYLTSGRDLLSHSAATPQQPPVVFADPSYDLPGDAQVLIASETSRTTRSSDAESTTNPRSVNLAAQTFGRLPGTEQEAQAILSLLPSATLLTGTQATENNLKQVNSPSILHIATHGFFFRDVEFVPLPAASEPELPDTLFATEASPSTPPTNSLTYENPLLRSGLAFAGFNPRQSGSEDGVLTALEASSLNLQGTQLVVLSACDTGLGDVVNGDGVYGLRRAFAIAGAESQLMSLWKVDDLATSELMTQYYQRLQHGEERSEALRQVQLELLRSPNYQHPYFWAAFMFLGDWGSL